MKKPFPKKTPILGGKGDKQWGVGSLSVEFEGGLEVLPSSPRPSPSPPSPLPKCVFSGKRFLHDWASEQRSRRATAWKRLVRASRIFFVFMRILYIYRIRSFFCEKIYPIFCEKNYPIFCEKIYPILCEKIYPNFWGLGSGVWGLGSGVWRNDPRGVKNIDFSKSLGMALPGVENVGVPWGSIFKLSRGPQLPYKKKSDLGPNLLIIPPTHPCCGLHRLTRRSVLSLLGSFTSPPLSPRR